MRHLPSARQPGPPQGPLPDGTFRPARRSFLHGLLALAAAGAAAPRLALGQTPGQAPGQPPGQTPGQAPGQAPQANEPPAFSTDWLKEEARRLAEGEHRPVGEVGPPWKGLDWEAYRQITFRPARELWHGQDRLFRLRFFHLGHYYLKPVDIYEVVDGRAHKMTFSRDMFRYASDELAKSAPENMDAAGFRIHFHTDFQRDMAAFLGASYFRAVGKEMQYGISARGIAIDTALPSQEEFPFFKAFWIEQPAAGQTGLTVHALLDSPSMTGAYRFAIYPAATTVMDVETTLFCRRGVGRLGLAPLTSMYHHGENDRWQVQDVRPEVHDSDGLAIWRGNGERVWRPLINPASVRVNAFSDENPRGFGLLQRDRDFTNYQDDGFYYDRRPNLWVEPQGQWGRGVVHLIEIPTDDEIFDNIVAFWTPERAPERGQKLVYSYRLHWGTQVPNVGSQIARVIATRTGKGGVPGQKKNRDTDKFVIDFAGGPLDMLPRNAPVEPVITASRGEIIRPVARPIEELGGWRASFDLRPSGREPVDLRCYLRLRSSALSETWICQWQTPS